jgi:hypothetical protein
MRQADKEEADCHPAELEKSAWDSPFAKPGRRGETGTVCVCGTQRKEEGGVCGFVTTWSRIGNSLCVAGGKTVSHHFVVSYLGGQFAVFPYCKCPM